MLSSTPPPYINRAITSLNQRIKEHRESNSIYSLRIATTTDPREKALFHDILHFNIQLIQSNILSIKMLENEINQHFALLQKECSVYPSGIGRNGEKY